MNSTALFMISLATGIAAGLILKGSGLGAETTLFVIWLAGVSSISFCEALDRHKARR